MDHGPASWPSLVSVRRKVQIRLIMSSLIALGLVRGRRGAGSECVPAAVARCGYELADAGLGYAVEAGNFGLGFTGQNGFDDDALLGHVTKAD